MIEKKYAKIIDNDTKEVEIGVGCPDEYYIEIGMEIMDVELAYDGNWYVAGYAPEKPEPTKEEKQGNVRDIRNNYLLETDYTQLIDAPLSLDEKEKYREYRQYLRDYTDAPEWWKNDPKTFEEWKADDAI